MSDLISTTYLGYSLVAVVWIHTTYGFSGINARSLTRVFGLTVAREKGRDPRSAFLRSVARFRLRVFPV